MNAAHQSSVRPCQQPCLRVCVCVLGCRRPVARLARCPTADGSGGGGGVAAGRQLSGQTPVRLADTVIHSKQIIILLETNTREMYLHLHRHVTSVLITFRLMKLIPAGFNKLASLFFIDLLLRSCT